MALRKIIYDPDPVLRKRSRPVGKITPHVLETLEDMVETMRQAEGVGLAAPQIGVLRRMFVAEPDPALEEKKVYYMIDPEILETEGSSEGTEGCLSIPDYIGLVERPERIRMKAADRDGNVREYEFEGLAARVMCHEYDHLDGILYPDRAEDVYSADEAEAEKNQGSGGDSR